MGQGRGEVMLKRTGVYRGEGVKKQRFYSVHTLWINPNCKRMN